MKKDNESPYRSYHVVSVKKIDHWFFGEHDRRRTHAKIYESVIRPMFGICENTFLDYRHESDELLELFRQSVFIEFSLWLPTMEAKYMNPVEAVRRHPADFHEGAGKHAARQDTASAGSSFAYRNAGFFKVLAGNLNSSDLKNV